MLAYGDYSQPTNRSRLKETTLSYLALMLGYQKQAVYCIALHLGQWILSVQLENKQQGSLGEDACFQVSVCPIKMYYIIAKHVTLNLNQNHVASTRIHDQPHWT